MTNLFFLVVKLFLITFSFNASQTEKSVTPGFHPIPNRNLPVGAKRKSRFIREPIKYRTGFYLFEPASIGVLKIMQALLLDIIR